MVREKRCFSFVRKEFSMTMLATKTAIIASYNNFSRHKRFYLRNLISHLMKRNQNKGLITFECCLLYTMWTFDEKVKIDTSLQNGKRFVQLLIIALPGGWPLFSSTKCELDELAKYFTIIIYALPSNKHL